MLRAILHRRITILHAAADWKVSLAFEVSAYTIPRYSRLINHLIRSGQYVRASLPIEAKKNAMREKSAKYLHSVETYDRRHTERHKLKLSHQPLPAAMLHPAAKGSGISSAFLTGSGRTCGWARQTRMRAPPPPRPRVPRPRCNQQHPCQKAALNCEYHSILPTLRLLC